MIRDKKNIDDLFRDSLKNYESLPDNSAWDTISERLTGISRKSILPFLLAAAGIAIVAAIGVALYTFDHGPNSGAGITEATGIIAETPSAIIQESTDKEAGNNTVYNSGTISANSPEKTVINNLPATINYNNTTINTANSDIVVQTEKEPLQVAAFADGTIRDQNLLQSGAEIPATITENADNTTTLKFLAAKYDNIDFQLKEPSKSGMTATFIYSALAAPVEETDNQKKNDAKWMLGGEFAPVYSYRHISSGYLDDRIIDMYNSAETGLLSYSGGMNISYSLSERVEIISGLQYSKYGQSNENAISLNYQELSNNINTDVYRSFASNSTGEISSGSQRMAHTDSDCCFFQPSFGSYDEWQTVRQIFEYLELPLVVKYKFINKKIDFHINGGLVTNLMIGNRVYIDSDGDESYFGRTEKIKEINYLGLVGIGIEYPLADNFGFTFEPRFRYYINSFDETGCINVHPYALGVYTGLRYFFR